jgi:hypothetical protein
LSKALSTARLRAATIVVGGLYACYLLIANVLLNSDFGLQLANRTPEKFVASWSSGRSLYPGHVRVFDVRLAGHVRRTIWSLQADSVGGRIALLPLLARELRVPSLVADGVSGGATRIDLERIPPEPRPGGWTLRFEDVAAGSVRYAYFDDLVLQGKGQGHAGFVKTLRGGPMEVLPSTFGFKDGVLFLDGERLAWDATIESQLQVARHRRDEAPGIRKLEKTDLDVAIEATTAGLRLEHDAQRRPTLRLSSGPGRLTGKIGWRQGSLAPGGSLGLAFPASGNLDGTEESTEATLGMRVMEAGIFLKGGVAPIHDGAIRATTDVAIQGTDIPLQNLGSLRQRASGQFAGQWHFDSLAWLSALLPGPKIVAFDGAGTAVADLKFRAGQLDAGSFVEVPQVAATAGALGNRFDGTAHAKITFDTAGPGEMRPHLVAEMQEFRIAPADAPDRAYVLGDDLRIEATMSGDPTSLADRVQARILFKDARVPDMRTYNRYLPNSKLRFLGGSGRISGDLHFDREGNVGHGTTLLESRQVQLALADLVLQGDIVVDTRLRRTELTTHRFDASGSHVTMKDVRVTHGADVLGSDWWGKVALDQMNLDWDRPATVDGKFKVQCKDAGVLLALYAQRKHLPNWVGKIVDAGEVKAEGRVRMQRGTLLLDPFGASNDRFDVLARLQLQEKQARGDLFARWGGMSVGVELDGGQRQVHLVSARKWYDARPSLAER